MNDYTEMTYGSVWNHISLFYYIMVEELGRSFSIIAVFRLNNVSIFTWMQKYRYINIGLSINTTHIKTSKSTLLSGLQIVSRQDYVSHPYTSAYEMYFDWRYYFATRRLCDANSNGERQKKCSPLLFGRLWRRLRAGLWPRNRRDRYEIK